ncbi:MAG: DUF4011 domain-containing protein, partial [Candidatus Hydrogenedentes bacterium]|nr:DUF4011 domain-containing protein [Candidatus Hydrogenedentota bacterium]
MSGPTERLDHLPALARIYPPLQVSNGNPRFLLGHGGGFVHVDDLQRRLGNLRRRAREWQEEQGLNVLFLALGFLRWTDEENQQVVSPLLLLPCRLERASPRDAFTLWQEDENLTT